MTPLLLAVVSEVLERSMQNTQVTTRVVDAYVAANHSLHRTQTTDTLTKKKISRVRLGNTALQKGELAARLWRRLAGREAQGDRPEPVVQMGADLRTAGRTCHARSNTAGRHRARDCVRQANKVVSSLAYDILVMLLVAVDIGFQGVRTSTSSAATLNILSMPAPASLPHSAHAPPALGSLARWFRSAAPTPGQAELAFTIIFAVLAVLQMVVGPSYWRGRTCPRRALGV